MFHGLRHGNILFATDSVPGVGGEGTPTPIFDAEDVGNEKPSSVKSDAKADRTFTQAELDEILKERLARATEKARREIEQAREKEEEERLAQQAQHKELATKLGEKVKLLESDRDALRKQLDDAEIELEAYRNVIDKQLTLAKRQLPEPVQSLLENLDLLKQMEWIATNADKLVLQKGTPVPPTPKPDVTAKNDRSNEDVRVDPFYRGRF